MKLEYQRVALLARCSYDGDTRLDFVSTYRGDLEIRFRPTAAIR